MNIKNGIRTTLASFTATVLLAAPLGAKINPVFGVIFPVAGVGGAALTKTEKDKLKREATIELKNTKR